MTCAWFDNRLFISEEEYNQRYEPSFLYNGVMINYHFKDRETMPKRLRIEPHFEYIDTGRGIDGRILRPKKELVEINVWGEYV